MSSRVDTNFHEKQGKSEVFQLTDVVTNESVALIPCDSAGNFTIAGISRAPIQKNAIQTTSQGGEWSDLEYPFMAIQQEDWTGGRANYRFSGDKSRFFDSKRAQTAFNECIFNAPLDYYSYGFKRAYTNHPDSTRFIKLKGDTLYLIREITVDNYKCGNIYIHLRRRGTPNGGLTVRLLNNMSSHPEIYAEHTFTTKEVADTTAEFYKFSFDEMTLDGTVYLEVYAENNEELNDYDYWEVGCTDTDSMLTYHSSSGSNWSLYKYDLLFRLDTVQDDIRVKFFTYNQLLFMVKQKPQKNPSLWLNGDIGKISSAGANFLTDGSKSWTENCYKDAKVGLIYRNGAEGHVSVWRTIVSNTSNTISIDSDWDITPTGNAIYIILDTPLWHEITGHGLTAYITDIHVIRDVVYFAQGDYVAMIKMRFNRTTGTFEWMELPEIYATFLHSVRDKAGMMLWRGRNDDDMHERSVQRSVLLDWQESYIPEDDDNDDDSNDDDSDDDSDDDDDKDDHTVDHLIIKKITEEITADAPIFTDTYDNELPDYDSKRYKITIKTFSQGDETTDGSSTSPTPNTTGSPSSPTPNTTGSSSSTSSSTSTNKHDGKVVFMLQQSEDNETWFNVNSMTADSTGTWYMTAHCDYRYRRFKITASGTDIKVNDITFYTTQIPHFEDRQILLDNYGKLTRLFEYGAESVKSLWVFQEGMVSSVNKSDETYTLDRFNLDEIRTTADEWNGSATSSNHVYLLWSWLNGLQRYYGTELEGKGPDHDEGMPDDMKGRITQILAYPGSFFVCIDAGENGYSSIMMFNGNGWHNLYKAPNKGERIFDIEYQPIYGDRPDRLWAQVGDNVIWLAMPSKILYALHDPYAEYTHESVVVSAWITGGMAEVEKLWQSLSIMADFLDGTTCWVEADYQLDDEETWHPIPFNPYDTSPQQEENFAAENESVNGKKLRYRLRLQTTDKMKSPKVNVVLIKAVGRIDIKYSYGFHFRNIKYKENLSSDYQEIEPYELQAIIDDWANRLCTLRLNSAYKIYDNKKVFVDGTTTSILTEMREGYLSQLTLTEI